MTTPKQRSESSEKIAIKGAIAGGIAGILDKLLTHPFDYIHTQMQLDKDKQIYTGTMDCFRKTLARRGFLGLYRGMSILLLANIPKVASRFAVYEYVNYHFEDNKGDVLLSTSFMAGLIAGFAEAMLFVTPLEVIKVTVLHDMSRPVPNHNSVKSVLWDIVKKHGIRGLFTGLSMTTFKEGTSQAIRFYLMCTQKNFYAGTDGSITIPTPMIGFFGMIAGAASLTSNVTADVIKTRMQARVGKCANPFTCFQHILHEEGLVAFFRGNAMRVTQICIEVAVTFMIYEIIMDYIFVHMVF